MGTAWVVTDIGGGWGLLWLYHILEGVEDCLGCNRYPRGLGTPGVVTYIGVGMGTAVVITDIGGGWGLLGL